MTEGSEGKAGDLTARLADFTMSFTLRSAPERVQQFAKLAILDCLAVAVLAEAMSTLGDPFSMLAFASNGRDDVEMTTVKAFSLPYDRACIGRLAALSSTSRPRRRL